MAKPKVKVKIIRRKVIIVTEMKLRKNVLMEGEIGRNIIKKEIAEVLPGYNEIHTGDSTEQVGPVLVFLSFKEFRKAHVLELLAASAAKQPKHRP
jgi:hypothetical protein